MGQHADRIDRIRAGFRLIRSGDIPAAREVFQAVCDAAPDEAARRGIAACDWLSGWPDRREARRRDILGSVSRPDALTFKTVIASQFKWADGAAALSSVFTGSNDRPISAAEEQFLRQLNTLAAEGVEIELVSLIGGMYSLDLISRVAFSHIRLFDMNIAEHSKLAMAANMIDAGAFEAFDGFRDLDAMIREEPTTAYAPALARDALQLEFSDQAYFIWEDAAVESTSLLSPIFYPELGWRPTREEYEAARASLRGRLNRELSFELPRFDAQGRIVVVFLSNSLIPQKDVHASITNARRILPYYKGAPPKDPADSHTTWVWVAERLVRGNSVHVWCPEEGHFAGTDLDKPCTTGMRLNDFCSAIEASFDTVLIHIFFGKYGNPVERRRLFAAALQKCATATSRVVVAEYNATCQTFLGNDSVPSEAAIIGLVGAEAPGFRHASTHFAPGEGEPDRNAFYVFERLS
jgi:hypothetical protein